MVVQDPSGLGEPGEANRLVRQPRLLHPVAPDTPKQRLTERFRSRAEGLVNSMRQIGIP
jgi:hypothetical protein